MSLRLKVALALVLLAGASTLIVGVVSYRATSAQLYDEIEDSLRTATGLVEPDRRDPRGFGTPMLRS